MRSYPRLPVLGWSAFSGERATPTPGVLSARYRRYTTSGRAAIALALRALEIRPGDKVLVPTYHCPTMIAPVARSGAEPMFYPITASGGADLEWLERAGLAGTRAMLATHYFGFPKSMSRLRAFCDAHHIALIEDCAHAFFGVSEGVAVGSWGDIAIASLPKFFPAPEGGLILSATQQRARLADRRESPPQLRGARKQALANRWSARAASRPAGGRDTIRLSPLRERPCDKLSAAAFRGHPAIPLGRGLAWDAGARWRSRTGLGASGFPARLSPGLVLE